MINFNNIKNNEELERASENLPSEIKITVSCEKTHFKYESQSEFIFVPQKEKIKKQDLIMENQNKSQYCVLYYDICAVDRYKELDNSEQSCSLFLDEIPQEIKSIHLYLHNTHTERHPLKNTTIIFEKMANDVSKEINENIFTYFYKNKYLNDHLFVGVFARVTNGWKFYPKFLEYNGNLNDILIMEN